MTLSDPARRVTPVVRLAPAKLNLTLAVVGRRDDGYHTLHSVMAPLALADRLSLAADPSPDAVDRLRVEGFDAGPPADNLVVRALDATRRALRPHLAAASPALVVRLEKRIPVAAGLAGGSSDAAAALVGADALFGLRTPRPDLLELAAELGSDVPFCLVGGTAMGSGRGEVVAPVMTRGAYWWVIVPDSVGLSTPDVYREFDRLTASRPVQEPEIPDELLAGLRAGDPERLGTALENDLQPAALSFRPDLAELLAAGRTASAHGALVSGSGPTTVFLCDSPGHAAQVDEGLQHALGTAPAIIAKGPVPGARLVGGRR